MTDITELAQRLKAAANTTADAIDRLKAFPGDELIDLSQHEGEQVDIDITTINEWYELSSPANILALVEALEGRNALVALQKIEIRELNAELEKATEPRAQLIEADGELEALRQRIAELESRAVKFADCDFGAVQHMSGGSKDYCHGFVDGTQNAIRAITAAGIKVEAE
ncbi:TPA: hypothetical protein MRT91_005074 [Klebsiella quasipneumoniae]|nr:hypothetical protein [Klebsiella quasipneumoniae]